MRVLFVEDDAELRRTLPALLHKADRTIEVVGVCPSTRAAISYLEDERKPVDVALVDLKLSRGGSGIDVLLALRRLRPATPGLVLTVFDDRATVLAALRAGASGYVLKDEPPRAIAAAITAVHAGEAPLSSRVARWLLNELRDDNQPDGALLTPRERDVLALLCEGRSYAETASALGIGEGTVQTHVKSIYGKLEVSSKAELTAVAFRRGLID